MAKATQSKEAKQPQLRIKMKSYDSKMLDSSTGKVIGLLEKSGAEFVGPIPLPRHKKIYTVLRSNFKFKDARDQFERRTYTRLIDVTSTGGKTMEFLQNLSIPVGVSVDVKVMG